MVIEVGALGLALDPTIMPESVVTAVALVFFLIMLAAALAKLDGLGTWRVTVDGFFPNRHRFAAAVFVVVPAAEAMTAVMLLLSPVAGLVVGSVLLAVLGAGVLVLRSNHRGQRCNCFGAVMPSDIGTGLAVRDLALAGMSAVAAAAGHGGRARPSLPAVLLAILLGIVGVVVAEHGKIRRIEKVGVH
jgi:hypothetical protein